MIDRRGFLKAAATVPFLAPALRAAQLLQSTHPNVLFILCDEWRGQATGYAGDANVRTPALNRLAAESVNFPNCCSCHPVCSPMKSSLITGQYPLTHGVFLNDEELKPKGTTLGQAFANAGYSTGWIGKWHMYGSPQGQYERRLAYIPPDHHFGFRYWKAAECTHDYNHSIYYEGDDPAPRYWPGYDAIYQTKDACHFIEQQATSGQPFFLVLSMGPPHFPLDTAPENYRALYKDRPIRLRFNVPEGLREKATTDLRGYYAHIAALDDCIADLISTLESSKLNENTIVIFTSDHGDMMYSQGIPSAVKHVPWNESVRPPFLLRYPKKLGTKGRATRTTLNTADIMPTLLGSADLAIPAGVEGTDYSGMLLGKTATPEDSVAFLQFPVSYGAELSNGFEEYRGVVTEQYTYVRTRKGPWMLYDNRSDPYQLRNLCYVSGNKELQSRMDRLLDAQLKERKDDFLPGDEYVKRFGYEHNREIALNSGRGTATAPAPAVQSPQAPGNVPR